MRILYVEDNATNVILVQRVANMGKHSVINYDNGEEALANFEKDSPDCVLLDVQLRGELSGLDVVAKLRERGVRLPIIALTAYAMKGDRQRCLDAGCDDYIPKPISVTELVSVFKRFNDAVISSRSVTVTSSKSSFYKPLTAEETKPVLEPVSPVPTAAPVAAKPANPTTVVEAPNPIAATAVVEPVVSPAVSAAPSIVVAAVVPNVDASPPPVVDSPQAVEKKLVEESSVSLPTPAAHLPAESTAVSTTATIPERIEP